MNKDSSEQNVDTAEVAPQAEGAQVEPVDAPVEASDSPEATPSDKEELILGKFKSQEELAKSYRELESQFGRINQSLRDPDFVYRLAQEHGLTEEEVEEAIDNAQQAQQSAPRNIRQPQVSVEDMVDQRLAVREDFNEALRLEPAIKEDPALMAWAASLVDSGLSHVEAVKLIQTKRAEWSKQGVAQGAQIARETETAKENATTAVPTAATSGGNAELEDIRERMKSHDSRVQTKAYEEFQLYKMRNPEWRKHINK